MYNNSRTKTLYLLKIKTEISSNHDLNITTYKC